MTADHGSIDTGGQDFWRTKDPMIRIHPDARSAFG